jgi:hypothetical protein
MRPSPSSLFVGFAMVLAAAVGMLARSAAGAEDPSSKPSALPSDATNLGFVPTGSPAHDVALLDATRPFRIALAHGPVHGVPAEPHRLAAARAIVARELLRYPRAFLQAIRMRGVVFADDLREGELAIPSLPNVGGLLLLDVDGTESDLVRGLHHEVFHFADLADDGSLAPDPSWDALNARGFAYGAGGRTLRAAWAAAPLESSGLVSGGFVSSYATSGCEEDKAETFAFAMARPAKVREQAAHDPVLAKKLDEITRRIGKLDADAARCIAPSR